MKFFYYFISTLIFFTNCEIEVIENPVIPEKYAKMAKNPNSNGNVYFRIPPEIETPELYYDGFPTFYKDGKELELKLYVEGEYVDQEEGSSMTGEDENFSSSNVFYA
uniref:Uncharacterized protein n=1 Tax=Parastrongyloides trichosuri TaxID=131310 RepID=A0A0N4ZWL9_PARTI